jgi:hypothetical protein
MKKIFLGLVSLILIAFFVFTAQISCQKITAQQNQQATAASDLVLYLKMVSDQIIPITHIDSAGNVILDRTDTLWKVALYTCNPDGSNNQLVPINLPPGMAPSGTNAHFVNDGTSIVFNAAHSPVYANGNYSYPQSPQDGIYTCLLNGTNTTQILSNSSGYVSLCDGH